MAQATRLARRILATLMFSMALAGILTTLLLLYALDDAHAKLSLGFIIGSVWVLACTFFGSLAMIVVAALIWSE